MNQQSKKPIKRKKDDLEENDIPGDASPTKKLKKNINTIKK